MKVNICGSCEDGAALLAALEALGIGAGLTLSDCMIVCDRPVTVSVRQTGKAAYLFENVRPEQAGEIARFLRLYAAAPEGIIEDAREIGQLRFCLRGRIPA